MATVSLTNIVPPDLRRKEKLIETIRKAENGKCSVLWEIIKDSSALRLKSRQPSCASVNELMRAGFDTAEKYRDGWTTSSISNRNLVLLGPNRGVK